MRAVVVYKWARDPGGATVRGDGGVQWRSTKRVAGEDDHAALAVARQVAESAGGDLVGLTVGDGDASWALARGVASAVSVPDAPVLADQSATAAVLAAAVRAAGGADVVVIGDAEEHAQVPAALAGHLGVPALLGVTEATVVDGRVQVRRTTGGEVETLTVAGPVVLAVSAAGPEGRAPGMKELLAARKRPVTTLALADLDVPAGAELTEGGTRLPEHGTARIFRGEPADTARELVAALRSEGVL
jgi:electron transfer flavoprotein beta subunit